MQVKSLNEIPQFLFPPLFRRQHLKQKPVIGFLGNPGEGKSFSLAMTLLMDGLMQLEPVWSNMYIKLRMKISDRLAHTFGLSQGGEVLFEAEAVDKMKLLRMDPMYKNGWHGLDEINAEYAEAMRSTSNVNLYFDKMEQQHRHDGMGTVYTAIHEMWVDPRVRKLTDAFVRVEDVALSPEGLNREMPQGEVFKWTVYPHSRVICGWTTLQTGMTLGPFFVHTKQFQGVYDTMQKQAEGRTHYAIDINGGVSGQIEYKESDTVIQERAKWGWLYQKIQDLHDQNFEKVPDEALWNFLQVEARGLTNNEVGKQLKRMGIQSKISNGHTFYYIDNFDLDRMAKQARVLREYEPVTRRSNRERVLVN